ncbi:NUDIX hydrolase [Planococcus lenghuensis]|uniref:Nudix hydrolase domain-containing protein n=1 Tax=Planococcus lenghuensis TaxID=2213202 RepID=A0A1Q2KZ42_9BACL|nr:hypothetical protein [Planococcus lenghuensis]AQQ53469.1 hypothetical protein B0X71_10545 [Planococcus lenghuensis]
MEFVKKACLKNTDVTTHFFLCKIKEGQITYQDPDDSIEEIAWKTSDESLKLEHDYPEDQETLLSFLWTSGCQAF